MTGLLTNILNYVHFVSDYWFYLYNNYCTKPTVCNLFDKCVSTITTCFTWEQQEFTDIGVFFFIVMVRISYHYDLTMITDLFLLEQKSVMGPHSNVA